MAELNLTDKFIIDRSNITYKTSFKEIQDQIDTNLLGDNVSLDPSDTVNMTVDILDNTNFGINWTPAGQKKSKIYTNVGVGAVDESWLYIGGNKRDAKINLVLGQAGQIQNISLEDPIGTSFAVGEYFSTSIRNTNNNTADYGKALITVTQLQTGIAENDDPEYANFITEITPVTSGSGYADGDVDIVFTDGNGGTETFTTYINIAPDSIQVDPTITASGTDFSDGIVEVTGIGRGLTVSITTANGQITNAAVEYVGFGFKPGDTGTIISPGAGEYGRDVNGYELTTWLGESAPPGPAKPNEGWVILSSLSDDGGYVLRSGDEMFGTLSILAAADPAIIAVNDITTDNGLSGNTVTAYTSLGSNGTLSVEGKSTLRGGFDAGDLDHTRISTIAHQLKVTNLAGYREMNDDFDAVVISDPEGNSAGTTIPLDDKSFITKGYFDKNNTGGDNGIDGHEYDIEVQTQAIDERSEGVFMLTEDGVDKTKMVFKAGDLIRLTASDGDNSLKIETDATSVIFSPTAPDPDVGKLWYNTLDGRLYVCYEDSGEPASNGQGGLLASVQWVDASPSAINGGDYVYKYGDIVNNFLRIQNDTKNNPDLDEAVFFAQHYILDELKNIADAPPTTTVGG